MYLHVGEDLCVDVTSTEVSLDDLDARSLACAVLSVDSQKGSEIFGQWSQLEFHKWMVGLIRAQDACVVAQSVGKRRIAIIADILKVLKV